MKESADAVVRLVRWLSQLVNYKRSGLGPDARLCSSSQASVSNHAQRELVRAFLSNVLNNNRCLLNTTVRASQESAMESAQACGPAHLLLSGETLAGHLRSSGKKTGSVWFLHGDAQERTMHWGALTRKQKEGHSCSSTQVSTVACN